MLTQIHIPFSRRGSRHRLPQASLVENTAAAVAAQFDRRPLEGRWLKVEVREQPVVNHPLTGKAVQSPPAAMLLQGRRPLSLLIGEVLIVDRAAARCVKDPLIAGARARSMAYEQVGEGQLHQLIPPLAA